MMMNGRSESHDVINFWFISHQSSHVNGLKKTIVTSEIESVIATLAVEHLTVLKHWTCNAVNSFSHHNKIYERLSRLTSTQLLWRQGMKNYVWTCMENFSRKWMEFLYKSQDSGKFIKQNLQTFTGEICYFPATWIELICSFIIQTLLYFSMAWLGCTRVNFYNMKSLLWFRPKKNRHQNSMIHWIHHQNSVDGD